MWAQPNLQIDHEPKHVKIVTISVWVLVGIGLLSCIVLQISPAYLRMLAWSAIIIMIGSASPYLLPEYREHKWWRWMRGICVAAVITTGALLSTYGWNERSQYFTARALIEAAALEWKQNDLQIGMMEFQSRLVTEHGSTGQLFVPPTHWHIVRAIDMTKLAPSSPEYSPITTVLLEYVRHIDYLCVRLEKINQSYGTPLAQQQYRRTVATTFGRGDAYPVYLKTHRLLEKTFRECYPGLLEQIDSIQASLPQVRPDGE